PAAPLVVVQADLALDLLEVALDGPSGARDPDQPSQRGCRRTPAGVVGEFPVVQAAAPQQPAAEPAATWGGDRPPGPGVDPAALGAPPGAEPQPLLLGDLGGQGAHRDSSWPVGGLPAAGAAGRPPTHGGA